VVYVKKCPSEHFGSAKSGSHLTQPDTRFDIRRKSSFLFGGLLLFNLQTKLLRAVSVFRQTHHPSFHLLLLPVASGVIATSKEGESEREG
jgi:hypothetical protein